MAHSSDRSRNTRFTATIVRDKNGKHHVRIGTNGVDATGDVTVIEAFEQRDGESPRALRIRAHQYIRDNGLR